MRGHVCQTTKVSVSHSTNVPPKRIPIGRSNDAIKNAIRNTNCPFFTIALITSGSFGVGKSIFESKSWALKKQPSMFRLLSALGPHARTGVRFWAVSHEAK